jgi:hypothetical protein
MAVPSHRSRIALSLTGVLLLGAGSGWSQAAPAGPKQGLYDGQAQPMLEALSSLTPAQRRDYLQALRTLEDTRSRAHITQLDQAQRCLAQAGVGPAVRGCWQTLASAQKQQRRQQMQQQQALLQRFGLPMPRVRGLREDQQRPQSWRPQWQGQQSRRLPLQPMQQPQAEPQLPYGWY